MVEGKAVANASCFFPSVKAMVESGEECVDEDWQGRRWRPIEKSSMCRSDSAGNWRGYGMHVVNLRPAMAYGRGWAILERLAGVICAGWFPPLPEAGNWRSLVHVQDVVEVARLVGHWSETKGRTYIIADPRSSSTREIYDALPAMPEMPHVGWSIPA